VVTSQAVPRRFGVVSHIEPCRAWPDRPVKWTGVPATSLSEFGVSTSDVPIAGFCAPEFEAVREQFERNFADRCEMGAALAVTFDNRTAHHQEFRDFPLAPMGAPCWRGCVPRCIVATLVMPDAALYPAATAIFDPYTPRRGDKPPPMRGRVNEDLRRTGGRTGETACARASLASRTLHDHFDGRQHAG
jgi:hypothetical protein